MTDAVLKDTSFTDDARVRIARWAMERNDPVSPAVVAKRLGWMLPVVGFGVTIAGAFTLLAINGSFEAQHTQLLAVVVILASVTVAIGGLLASGILLWGAFVGQYLAALDARTEMIDLQGESAAPEASSLELQDEGGLPGELDAQAQDVFVETFPVREVQCEVVLGELEKEILGYVQDSEPGTSSRWVKVLYRSAKTGRTRRIESIVRQRIAALAMQKDQA